MVVSIGFSTARRRLATLWLSASALLILIMVVRTFGGAFIIDDSDRGAQEAWSWFLPTIMPTLSLMLGSLMIPAPESKQAILFPYRVALYVSAFYLGLVALAMTLLPGSDEEVPLKYLMLSNLWLAPLQGVVATCLGWFFVKSE